MPLIVMLSQEADQSLDRKQYGEFARRVVGNPTRLRNTFRSVSEIGRFL